MNWSEIEHFTPEEFACHCGCGQCDMDETFIRSLDEVRRKLGFPLTISSGYRCPDHNDAVSSTGHDGPHTTGKAADIVISGEQARRFLSLAATRFRGLGINQSGDWDKRFIHVDDLGFRLWTY